MKVTSYRRKTLRLVQVEVLRKKLVQLKLEETKTTMQQNLKYRTTAKISLLVKKLPLITIREKLQRSKDHEMFKNISILGFFRKRMLRYTWNIDAHGLKNTLCSMNCHSPEYLR